jgi:flagellar basal-body rod protein FlgF
MENAVNSLSKYMKRCEMRLTVTSNNLANGLSSGFKKSLAVERGDLQGAVVDLAPGSLNRTENPLDLAIQGDGFFTIKTASGNGYTRRGDFMLNDKRQLVTARGEQVLDNAGRAITVNDVAKVNRDGSVYSGEQLVARLGIVKPDKNNVIVSSESGILDFTPMQATRGQFEVMDGAIENSNVNPLSEMTSMVEMMRTFGIAEKIMKVDQGLGERCANEVGNTAR